MAEPTVKHKVLIIEDNKELLEMTKFKLIKEGFDVTVAEDGEKGLLVAVDLKPDIILLDVLTPNMNGWEVLKAIKNNTSLKAKILVVSNLGSDEQIQKAKELGADGYLVKANSTMEILLSKVREQLGIK